MVFLKKTDDQRKFSWETSELRRFKNAKSVLLFIVFFFETSAPGLPGSTCNLVCNLCVQLVQPKRGCFWLSDPRSCKPSGALRKVRSDALGSHGVSMNFYRCICLLLSTRMTCSNSFYLFGLHYSCPLGFQLSLLTSILEALVSPQNPVKGCFFSHVFCCQPCRTWISGGAKKTSLMWPF